MKQNDLLNIIPARYTRNNIITEMSCSFKNKEEAASFYVIARGQVLNVSNWLLRGMIQRVPFNF